MDIRGPRAERAVNSLPADPENRGTVYARTSKGPFGPMEGHTGRTEGAMRSCSIAFRPILLVLSICPGVAAASWTNISNGLTRGHEGVQVLTVDPPGSTLYALGSQAFKSTDGGSNWRMLGGITGARVLVVDPVS